MVSNQPTAVPAFFLLSSAVAATLFPRLFLPGPACLLFSSDLWCLTPPRVTMLVPTPGGVLGAPRYVGSAKRGLFCLV